MKRFVLTYESGTWSPRTVLTDTLTNEIVGIDGGEPEDQSFYRDWAWVPVLLNKLADEITTLQEKQRMAIQKPDRQ